MLAYMKQLIKRFDLMRYLVISGLKAENRNSYLGYFWWLLDPLLGVVVYYFLVVIVLKRGGEDYAVFLVIGLVAWRWTASTISSSARSIIKYTSIINQVYLPKAIFPITGAFAQLINFLFGLVVVAIFLAAFGIMPGWQLIYFPVIIAVQLVFLTAISLFVAYICVFIRDIDNTLTHIIRLIFYATPVIWEGGRLPAEYRWLVDINPFAHIINAYRDVLLYQSTPQLKGLLIIGMTSLVIVIVFLRYYSRNEHKIIKAL